MRGGGGFFVPIAFVFLTAAAVMLPMTGGKPPADSASTVPAREPAADLKSPEAQRSANVETATTLLAQFFGEPLRAGDTEAAILERVRIVAAKQGYSVDSLIVTVPDPIDSHSRWQFDPIQDAIQRAASVNDFVLDRFYLPDWKPWVPLKDAAKERSRLHESGPVSFCSGTTRSPRCS